MGQKTSRPLNRQRTDFEVMEVKFPIADLPDDIIGEILSRVSGQDLVKACVYVCKRWGDIINTQKLWKDKCMRDYFYSIDMLMGTEDFKTLYFKNPYNTNLIKNPDASEGMKHWTVTAKGGNGWQVEAKPIGSHPVQNYTNTQTTGQETGCWSTSYSACTKEQLIDLSDRGCSIDVLEYVQPEICVSEWYAARFDCGIKYDIKVELLGADKTKLDDWTFSDWKPAARDWFSTGYTFTYKPGVRFIKFTHGGRDTQFWAGNYGAKMTLSTVKLDFAHRAGSSKERQIRIEEVSVKSN